MTARRAPPNLSAVYVTLIAAAALWGTAMGLLVPRAGYRLSVGTDEPWRGTCSAGHPFTGPARGWLGGPRCPSCAATPPAGTAETPPPTDAAPPARTEEAPSPARTEEPPRPAPAPVTAPVTVGITGLACAVLAAATGPRPELAVWLILAPFAVLLALVDRTVHRLPDRLTLPLAAAAAVLLGAVAPLPDAAGSWPTALLGGLALGAGYFVLFLIHPNGLGFGDVKLALSLGVVLGWYGWGVLLVGAFAGFLFGSVYGVGLMLLGRADRKTAIPFGPFMIGGALAGLLLGALAAGA
ncbi:prepilin peptidase [Streptomyces sp. NPDC020965]|uniref:prepilin peptidase n=1 Tax=Streptomyces sp. NPDC020965 TaxID=3365105 RepID=UPI0037A3753D